MFKLFGLGEGQLGRQVQPGDPGQVQGGVLGGVTGGVLGGVEGGEQAGVQVGMQHQLEQGQAGVQPAESDTGLAYRILDCVIYGLFSDAAAIVSWSSPGQSLNSLQMTVQMPQLL